MVKVIFVQPLSSDGGEGVVNALRCGRFELFDHTCKGWSDVECMLVCEF